MTSLPRLINVTLAKIEPVNSVITRFTFERPDGQHLPAFSGGSNIIVEMEDDGKTHRNPYSLMSDPNDLSNYQITVRRDDDGRGGSLFMHQKTHEGMEMSISYPANLFPLDLRARKHLMIAGGIGITPFMSQIKQLDRIGGSYELHYSVRSASVGAFVDDLVRDYPNRVRTYINDDGQSIDLETLLTNQEMGTQVYVCGPKGMIEWVHKTAAELGWPDTDVHSEEFIAPARGNAFNVHLEKSNLDIEVSPDQSLLEAMEAAGVDAPYLCRGGACGQCETRVLKAEGTFLHNDHWLTEKQRKEGNFIMPCVSRFQGENLEIDR